MPLTNSTGRKLSHKRNISCYAYERDDGLWDIEAHMTDAKTFSIMEPFMPPLKAGDYIHDMWLRITVDRQRTVVAVEAKMDAKPYRECHGGGESLNSLVGLKITTGFLRKARARISKRHRCTHLAELLGPIGTTAHQALFNVNKEENPVRDGRDVLNSCYAYSETSELIKRRWPHLHVTVSADE